MAETTVTVPGNLAVPVLAVTVPRFRELFQVLGLVERKFPARVLRRLKKHVHELVLANEPNGRLYVEDIDVDTDVSRVDVVLGVGARQQQLASRGYVAPTRHDLMDEVLQPTLTSDPERIVHETMPQLLRTSARVPVFRYLREAGLLDARGRLVPGAEVDDRVVDRAGKTLLDVRPTDTTRPQHQLDSAGMDFGRVIREFSFSDVSIMLPLMPVERIDVEALRRYVESNRPSDLTQRSAWAKLVWLYDYLRFGPGR